MTSSLGAWRGIWGFLLIIYDTRQILQFRFPFAQILHRSCSCCKGERTRAVTFGFRQAFSWLTSCSLVLLWYQPQLPWACVGSFATVGYRDRSKFGHEMRSWDTEENENGTCLLFLHLSLPPCSVGLAMSVFHGASWEGSPIAWLCQLSLSLCRGRASLH